MKKKYLLLASVFIVTACEQGSAPIQDLGKTAYNRGAAGSTPYNSYNSDSGNSSYPRYSSNYSNTPVNSTPVPNVGVSDLPPAGSAPAAGGEWHPPSNSASSGSVSTGNVNDPFKTPPSQPLASGAPAADAAPASGPLTPQDKALDKAPVSPDAAEQPSVYSKDGISLIWPVNGGKITAHFQGINNDGINISMSEGEPIVAAASGVVVYSGNDLRDYGNMVIVRHDNGWLTAYANASKITAKKGAYVKQGDIIAYVGSSGSVKTPQLHFALRKGKTPVDPEKYLPSKSAAFR